MKRSNFLLMVYLLLGLIAGSLLGKILPQYEGLQFLVKSMDIAWHPAVNLDFLQLDFRLALKLHLLNFLGMIVAFWLYRRA